MKLESAKNLFEDSKVQSEKIRIQGNLLAEQISQEILKSANESIERLKKAGDLIVKFEEEKLLNEVVWKDCVLLILEYFSNVLK